MKLFSALLAIALMTGASAAQATDFSLGVKASSLGGGIEGVVGVNRYIDARVGVNAFSYGFDRSIDDIKYDLDLDLRTAGLVIDVHPLGGGLRLTGGVFYDGNGVDGNARPTRNVEIGNTTYTPNQVGSLFADASFNDVAPYLGIGWGTAVAEHAGFHVSFDAGVLFQGAANVKLRAERGTLNNNAQFQNSLRREEAKLEDDAEPFKFFPVIGLAISYRF